MFSQTSHPQRESEWLSEVLSALARKHQVPGVQLAIHRNGGTVAVAAGETEYGSGEQVTIDTAFPIGSITKAFTATVAMVLVADSDLGLDTPIGEYLPEFGNCRDDCPRITLRQLLSHTSGLAAGPDSVTTASVRRYVLDHCGQSNLILPPGTAFSYSNAGYVLTGHLIETITGMNWWEATELILLKPLGITASFIAAPPVYVPERPIATGHSVNLGTGRTVAVQQDESPAEAPAGNLAVSAADLVTLGLLHFRPGMPELLPSRHAEHMRRPVPHADPFGLADGWGLGLAIYRDGGTEWVGHDGNADGTSCYLRIDPAGGRILALTSNANTGVRLWRDLLAELREADTQVAPPDYTPPIGQPSAPPHGCLGTFSDGDSEYVVTAGEGGQPGLVLDGRVLIGLAFHDELAFEMLDVTTGQSLHIGRFVRDPMTGEIDGIQIGGRLARRRAGSDLEICRC